MKHKESLVLIKQEVGDKTFGYIMTALGLVAGLAWNEAIKSLIDTLFPGSNNGLMAKFLYALVITLFVVLIGVYLTKLFKKNNRLDDK